MADGDLLMIFRSFSDSDLSDKKDALISQMTTLSSQAVGSKSFTRDLRHLKDQLAAVVFVMNERGTPCGYVNKYIIDFSDVRPAPPAGTLDQMSF